METGARAERRSEGGQGGPAAREAPALRSLVRAPGLASARGSQVRTTSYIVLGMLIMAISIVLFSL